MPKDHEERRELKIKTAEGVIVPHLGRESLVRAVVRNIDTSNRIVFIESIGGEEYAMLTSALCERYCRSWDNVNIRRLSELPGIDIRQLLPGARDIWNSFTTVDQWQRFVTQELMKYAS